VLLLALFLRGVPWGVLGSAFRNAHRVYLVGVVLAAALTYMVRAWRWGDLLAPITRLSYSRLLSATIVGFAAGLLVPRAGEVVRPYLAARRGGVRTSAAFASIILERLFDLIAVLGLFGLYLYVLPPPKAQTRGPLLDVLKAGGAAAALAALGVGFLLVAFHFRAERVMSAIDRLLGRLPARIASGISQALRSFGEGLSVLQAPAPHLLKVLGQSFLVWLIIGVGFFWNNRAFGVELPLHASFLLVGLLTVGVAIPTPGMVGGFHEAYRLALTEVYGVDKTTAAAAGIAAHALTNIPVLFMGLWFLKHEGLTFGKVAEMTESSSRPTTEKNGSASEKAAEDSIPAANGKQAAPTGGNP